MCNECMGTAGLAVVKGNVVFDINAEDSHDRMYIVRMVAEVNGDAEHNVKCEACGRRAPTRNMTLPFSLPQIGDFSFGPDSDKKANITRLPWGGGG